MRKIAKAGIGISGVAATVLLAVLSLFTVLVSEAGGQPPPYPPLRVQDSSGTPTGKPRVLQFTGCTVTYSGSTVTISACAGTPSSGADPFSVGNLRLSGNTLSSTAGTAPTFSATAPAAAAASQAGVGVTISASNAVDGNSTHAAANGAGITLTAGTGVNGGTVGMTTINGPLTLTNPVATLTLSTNGTNRVYLAETLVQTNQNGWVGFTGSNDATASMDAGIARGGGAGVTRFTGAGLNTAAWQAGNNNGASRPTCASGYRGTYWHVYGGAGVADTVAVCCKNVGDTYVWSTAFLSSGTCS